MFDNASAWYFDFLRVSASDAAHPATREVLNKCDGAMVSEDVKSHTRQRPCFQGTSVTPSGRLPSSLSSEDALRLESYWDVSASKGTSKYVIHRRLTWMPTSTATAREVSGGRNRRPTYTLMCQNQGSPKNYYYNYYYHFGNKQKYISKKLINFINFVPLCLQNGISSNWFLLWRGWWRLKNNNT